MTQSRPFSFDNDFGDEGRGATSPVRRKRVYLADEVETIRVAAVDEGENSIASRARVIEAKALTEIADAMRIGLTTLAEVAREHRQGSAALALAAARKIAGGALERFPEAPVRAALEALGREIESQPRLVVRVADPSEGLRAAIETAATDTGFAGQIVFRPDENLAVASFVIEWSDGRAGFDPEAVADRIAQAFEAALAADGVHGEPLSAPAAALEPPPPSTGV